LAIQRWAKQGMKKFRIFGTNLTHCWTILQCGVLTTDFTGPWSCFQIAKTKMRRFNHKGHEEHQGIMVTLISFFVFFVSFVVNKNLPG
jgi:hypothetical protein